MESLDVPALPYFRTVRGLTERVDGWFHRAYKSPPFVRLALFQPNLQVGIFDGLNVITPETANSTHYFRANVIN